MSERQREARARYLNGQGERGLKRNRFLNLDGDGAGLRCGADPGAGELVEGGHHASAVGGFRESLKERGKSETSAARPLGGKRPGEQILNRDHGTRCSFLSCYTLFGRAHSTCDPARKSTLVTPDPRPVLTGPFLHAAGTNFFFFACLNSFILLPLYIQRLGGTEAEIGIVMGMYSASAIVCQPLVGAWVDRIGRRPFMLLGVSLAVLSSAAFAVSASIWLFIILRVLQGVAFSAFFVANYTLIVALAPPERRGWALGLFGISGLLPTALAPLAGEWVIRWLGYQALFLDATLLAAVALVMTLGIRGPRSTTVAAEQRRQRMFPDLREVLHLHMAVAFVFGIGTGTLFTFLPTFAGKLGVTNLSLFYTGYAGSAMLVRAAAGGLIDSLGRRAVIIPSTFTQMVASGILTVVALLADTLSATPALLSLLLAGILSGGAHGFLFPALTALVTDLAPESRRGQAVAVFSSVTLIGSALGAMTFGYVAHRLGYGAMFGVLSLSLAGGFAASLKLRGG